MSDTEDFEWNLRGMWGARNSEAIIKHIDYSFYDGNLDCAIYPYFHDSQDFFLEMANSDELTTRALAHILLTPRGLLDSSRENFYVPEHATLYKMKDILPVYEKFFGRTDFMEDDLELAATGFIAVVKGLRGQMNENFLTRILTILAKYGKNQLPIVLQMGLKEKVLVFEKMFPFIVRHSEVIQALYDATCSIPADNSSTVALEDIFIDKKIIQRNFVNFLLPFMVGRGYTRDFIARGSLYGAPTEATNLFHIMRNNSMHLDFFNYFQWHESTILTIHLVAFLEICLKPATTQFFKKLDVLLRYSRKQYEISCLIDQPDSYGLEYDCEQNHTLYSVID